MAKLTKSVNSHVFMGISTIKLIPQTNTLTATSFDDADEIFTVKDSVNISQTAPTKTESKVDQFDTAIAVAYEPGEFTITMQLPSNAKELLEYFFETLPNNIVITGYTESVGIELTTKRTKVTMLIESQDKSTARAYMNVEFVAVFAADGTSTTPQRIDLTGTVLANPEGPDIIDFYKIKENSSPSGI